MYCVVDCTKCSAVTSAVYLVHPRLCPTALPAARRAAGHWTLVRAGVTDWGRKKSRQSGGREGDGEREDEDEEDTLAHGCLKVEEVSIKKKCHKRR